MRRGRGRGRGGGRGEGGEGRGEGRGGGREAAAQVQQRSRWDSARPMPYSGLEQRRAFSWPGWPRGL